MSDLTCMSLPRKRNVLKSSRNLSTCKAQSSSQTASVNAVCYSSIKTSAHISSPHKVKCLKTRKERNQIRGQERNRSHTCLQHSRKICRSEKAQHNGCHSVVSSRKEKSFAKPFLPHKPSIITEGRLTSIRGLFSHEVRSIDIERVVSEQLNTEKRRKNKGKRSVMHVSSPLPPHPPSMPESDQDCILDEVQEPLQEPEKNTRDSRKELRRPPSALQTNKEVLMPKGLSRQDEKHYRSTNTVKKDTNMKSRPHSSCSLKGTNELMVLSLAENKLAHQFCSPPDDKNFLDFQEIDSPKSHNENNRTGTIDKENCAMKIQRSSAVERLCENDVRQSKSDPFSSEMDSWTGTLTENDRVQISVSVREAVNKLAARLELHVPRRPLLAECRDVLLHALQKTHCFHLQHNLSKLHSFIDGKQTSSFGSGQTHEECSQICFSHALGNEESDNRNTDIWGENAIQQEYVAEKVSQDSGRGASMKKRRVQAQRRFTPPVSLIQPLQSSTDMLLGDLLRRGESMKNLGLDLISHQVEEKTDPMFNLNSEYENRTQKAQETFLGESSFWANQLQVQDVRDRWAPLPSSASFPSECFQYKPFFRYPHPSNSRDRSDWDSMTLCVRSNTPDKVFYHHWE
ncbi:hypothetical protein E1301_Tti010734 [Triplophysa tibetana]|uniref:Uncharacterized protein n=1 Tax=Triplophysa tibetana TaxID=1572043 RepID=A0A5A9N1S9_9TELE|nr:hypothetical protein E1301_Tti010734 [Triplophysa tibetana]